MKGADGVFDRMEKREEEFGEEVAHMMNGEEFQTLRKIYDADMSCFRALLVHTGGPRRPRSARGGSPLSRGLEGSYIL